MQTRFNPLYCFWMSERVLKSSVDSNRAGFIFIVAISVRVEIGTYGFRHCKEGLGLMQGRELICDQDTTMHAVRTCISIVTTAASP